MALFYAASTAGFFDDQLSAVLPPDARPITQAAYRALLMAQAAGQRIVAGADGMPFAEPVPVPPPTLAQRTQAALAAGLTIVSTSDPALHAVYAVDSAALAHIQAEMLALLINGGDAFANGADSLLWPDQTGLVHRFSVAGFRGFAGAVAAYVAGVAKCANGTLIDLPSSIATIP